MLRWSENHDDEKFDRDSHHHPKFAKRVLLGTTQASFDKLADKLNVTTHAPKGSSVRRLTNRHASHLSRQGNVRPKKWWPANSEYYDLKNRCGWRPHGAPDDDGDRLKFEPGGFDQGLYDEPGGTPEPQHRGGHPLAESDDEWAGTEQAAAGVHHSTPGTPTLAHACQRTPSLAASKSAAH